MTTPRKTRAAVLAAAVCMAGCASYGPGDLRIGQSLDDVARVMGAPTGRYPLADGATRVEYARGPYGRHTYMFDVDRGGRVQALRQVLIEPQFNTIAPGQSRDDVLATLGRPSYRRPGGWPGGEVWAWRYDSLFCQWFMASIDDAGRVSSTSYGPDPICDDPYDSR